jgi:hypothetical protein
MRRIITVLAVVILTVFFTLFFFLTPKQIISKINDALQTAVFSAGQSDGNFLVGYHFRKVSLAGKTGTKLLSLEEVRLGVHLLPLFLGQIGITIDSKDITAAFSVGFDGSVSGAANFADIPFDTAFFFSPANVSFSAPISGRVIASGRKADIEVRADEITWKKLSLSGFDLPLDIFEKGRGGISVEQGRIIAKSFSFEGRKGYARLSGELLGEKQTIMLDLFPNDWDDLMLIPLARYKVSEGQYKMPLNIKDSTPVVIESTGSSGK